MLDKDLEIHRSPRFDLNGLPKRPFTVSDSTCEIPRNWLGSSDTKTRTLLLEKRKKAMIPDITYDVDGDGFVGHTDMAIAKIFDKNRDGVLDEKEIHNMRKAIDEGAMDHYIWGLDQGGSSEHPRLIQHKGKFITEGNYVKTLPLADLNKPMGRTSSQVKLEATKELRAKAECFSEKYFEKHPLKINYVPPIIYEHVAEFQSISEKKKELKKIARDKIGLTEPTDTKDYSKMPKYKYVENPHISSLKEFKAARKQKMLDELHETKNYDHRSRMLNFQERENNFIRIIPESSNCKTKKKLLEQRKLETNQINLKTFSNLTIGIHGKELPKFSENLEEYWKVRNEWKESPKNSTQTELLLSRNQKRLQGENVSDFKKNSEKKVGESAEKPRNFSGKGENVPAEGDKSKKATPAVHKYRPSTIFGYFLKSKTPETLKIDAKTVQTREKSRGEPRISVIENNTQGISTTYQTKSRSFIKKQGTSSRMLRSRGFIS